MREEIAQEVANIEQLTHQLAELFESSQFEELTLLIEERFNRLKALDSKFRQEENSDSDWAEYRAFLLKIQALDTKQVDQVVAEKEKLSKSTLKIDKGKAAVGVYKNVLKG